MELGSTHDAIIDVAKAGVLLALEHNMLPKPILQEALRWAGHPFGRTVCGGEGRRTGSGFILVARLLWHLPAVLHAGPS